MNDHTPTLGGGWRIDGNGMWRSPSGLGASSLPLSAFDAIDALNAALSTPADLPDGVAYVPHEGAPSDFILHAGCSLPEGWEWWWADGEELESEWVAGDPAPVWKLLPCYVRPSQKPRTERVPWVQALIERRKSAHNGETITAAETYTAAVSMRCGDGPWWQVDADGTVDVLIEDSPR